MKYFAYGEMMYSPQLMQIVTEAKCLGVAKLMGYRMYFHSRGLHDPSGKCNIVPVKDANSEIYGVLYDIPVHQRCLLDKAEGLGYGNQETTLKVFPTSPDNKDNQILAQSVYAFTYIAHKDNVFEDLVPYSWYKEMIIVGAKEHHLPADYIHYLEQFASTPDPNVQRANKQKRNLESSFL